MLEPTATLTDVLLVPFAAAAALVLVSLSAVIAVLALTGLERLRDEIAYRALKLTRKPR